MRYRLYLIILGRYLVPLNFLCNILSTSYPKLACEHGCDEVDRALGHGSRGEVADEPVEAVVHLQQVQHAQLVLHAGVGHLVVIAKGLVGVVDGLPLPVAAPAPAVAPDVIQVFRALFSYSREKP